MNRIRTAVLVVGIAVLALTGCSSNRSTDPAPIEAPEPAALSQEEQAQLAASTMDPIFADDEVWAAALDVAHSFCNIAELSDGNSALELSVLQGAAEGVTPEQVGIMAGVGMELYCPTVTVD